MYIEFVWEPKPASGSKTVWKHAKIYVFQPNPDFNGKWVLKVDDHRACDFMLRSTSFEPVAEGEALKSDPEFVRTVLENSDVVMSILAEGKVEFVQGDLEERHISALRSLAKGLGRKIKPTMKKDEIIQVIMTG